MKKLVLLAFCFCGVVAFAQDVPLDVKNAYKGIKRMKEKIEATIDKTPKNKDKKGDKEQSSKGVTSNTNDNDPSVVSLVVSADGVTKTQAIDNALRSAIEQTYGTFVSANTQILNDQLVKDEIATVSSGNIQKYTEIASVTLPNGNTSVTLNVTVSLAKLISYAQSKGSECEFAGATFGANLRLYKFNKKNEEIAIQNMIKQLDALRPIYDYEIDVSEPKLSGNDTDGLITIQINVVSNDKTMIFNNIIKNTIMSLAMTREKIEPLMNTGFEFYPYVLCLDGEIKKLDVKFLGHCCIVISNNVYYFYTKELELLDDYLNKVIYDFSITDNLGNEFLIFDKNSKEDYSIGHSVLWDEDMHWGFEYNKLNTHTIPKWQERFEYPVFAINQSRIVWKFPRIPFTIPVGIISNISKISISPTKEKSTNFLFSSLIAHSNINYRDNIIEKYKAIDIDINVFSSRKRIGLIGTKYNSISTDQTFINNLKELRQNSVGATLLKEY